MEGTKSDGNAHLVWAIGGLIAGTFIARKAISDSKKSRAELDHPDETEDVYTEVTELLGVWEPNDECEDESDFLYDLAKHFEQNSELVVEVCPDGPEGQPDLVIEDLVALELKHGLKKSERDRAIGQCMGYSRLWITLLVVIDAPLTKVKRMIELMEDRRLEQVEVWTVDT